MFFRRLKASLVYLLLLILTTPALAYEDPDNENLSSLISYLEKKGFEVQSLLDDPRFELYQDIADRFRKSAERKSQSLDSYKRVLNFEDKARKIDEFMAKYSDQLKQAEQEYGIPSSVIAAIIGIESDFGKNVGSYNPFNAYVSMYANEYRKDFAKAQILELLKFTKRKNIDVFDLKSSYAGAITFAQFIPYSLNKWFVGDDIFDMNNNIMSVGNYLAYFKKRTGDIETAVLRYNPSRLYTKAVMDLAEQARS
ncbi:lytic murein transglycosylase [Fodinibius sp.]|uniref:lytic murein transglycosylase n=1 Tax=Fodinibius sp. TaxID=1872440 RepID=UPI002ACD61FD|nr:lytic murein transglycosylase [Fodinibius sp.]MDZ7659132.1 lytic murein transglycosylase [Fodinibius sp.]